MTTFIEGGKKRGFKYFRSSMAWERVFLKTLPELPLVYNGKQSLRGRN